VVWNWNKYGAATPKICRLEQAHLFAVFLSADALTGGAFEENRRAQQIIRAACEAIRKRLRQREIARIF
jgi:hypothetical protein